MSRYLEPSAASSTGLLKAVERLAFEAESTDTWRSATNNKPAIESYRSAASRQVAMNEGAAGQSERQNRERALLDDNGAPVEGGIGTGLCRDGGE